MRVTSARVQSFPQPHIHAQQRTPRVISQPNTSAQSSKSPQQGSTSASYNQTLIEVQIDATTRNRRNEPVNLRTIRNAPCSKEGEKQEQNMC